MKPREENPSRFGKAYWSRVGETFAITTGTLFVAQLTQLQEVAGGSDPAAYKKLALSTLAGIGTGIVKSLWLAYRFRKE